MTIQRPTFNICVFCGSRTGDEPAYADAARELGATLAERGYGLVYGGSSMGLMGLLADSCLEAGGFVEGIIPDPLFLKESAHPRLSARTMVPSMHARKATMLARSNAFITLPGGLGTLESLFEVITWAQLGIHAKPIAVWNVSGYYDGLFQFVETSAAHGFISSAHRRFVAIRNSLADIFTHFDQWKTPTSIATWIDHDQM